MLIFFNSYHSSISKTHQFSLFLQLAASRSGGQLLCGLKCYSMIIT
uniref:Uncharacterized protein n=1 Tax=Rhizophora mucronata TaxID=61149 RepID=A0A2P2PQ04_RHIMU